MMISAVAPLCSYDTAKLTVGGWSQTQSMTTWPRAVFDAGWHPTLSLVLTNWTDARPFDRRESP
jgi:hypothetical protein